MSDTERQLKSILAQEPFADAVVAADCVGQIFDRSTTPEEELGRFVLDAAQATPSVRQLVHRILQLIERGEKQTTPTLSPKRLGHYASVIVGSVLSRLDKEIPVTADRNAYQRLTSDVPLVSLVV
jgi:hypothetical protein